MIADIQGKKIIRKVKTRKTYDTTKSRDYEYSIFSRKKKKGKYHKQYNPSDMSLPLFTFERGMNYAQMTEFFQKAVKFHFEFEGKD